MAKSVNHKRGSAIIVDTSRVGAADQFVSREKPAAGGPRRVRTTWECNNCGNALVSIRGVSRCPRCGSLEVIRVDEVVPQRQKTPALRAPVVDDNDADDDSV